MGRPSGAPRVMSPAPRTVPVLLPAVVREGLVRLGHLVGVLTALDRCTETVRRVEDLVHETLGHRLLTAGLGVRGEPAQCEGVRTVRLDLDRHLVGRTTDAAGADLEGRAHVVERLLERDDRVLLVL